MALSQTELEQIDAATRPFPHRRSGLLPALHIVQASRGCLDQEAMIDVAGYFDLHPMEVKEVVTFYTMFNEAPIGKYHLQVCRSISCFVMGCNRILEHLQSRLGISPGETTPDGMFTLSAVECLGSCGTSPVIQVNEDYYEDLDEEKVDRILDELRKNGARDGE
jgi:NADH-quinone oxidoreductase E subunit